MHFLNKLYNSSTLDYVFDIIFPRLLLSNDNELIVYSLSFIQSHHRKLLVAVTWQQRIRSWVQRSWPDRPAGGLNPPPTRPPGTTPDTHTLYLNRTIPKPTCIFLYLIFLSSSLPVVVTFRTNVCVFVSKSVHVYVSSYWMEVNGVVFFGQRAEFTLRHRASRPHQIHIILPVNTHLRGIRGKVQSSTVSAQTGVISVSSFNTTVVSHCEQGKAGLCVKHIFKKCALQNIKSS